MKKLIAMILALVMVLALVACSNGQQPAGGTQQGGAQQGGNEGGNAGGNAGGSEGGSEGGYTIAMLPKFKGENYFDGCYVGAKKAAEELGVTLVYDGPNQSEATNAKQVEILEGFIAAGVDAIVVSPCDAEGIVPTLKKAIDAGIVVTTFDADAPAEARAFYVNAATAADIGKGLVDALAKTLAGQGWNDEACRVALISGSGLDTNQNEWILAIEAYMAEAYPWMYVNCDETGYLGGDIWTPGSDETAAQNAANETIALSGNAKDGSQINAVIGTSSMSTPALAAAWNAVVGEKPVVAITGLATPMGLVDYILDEENPMDYGVLWDVNCLGYLAVEATLALLEGKIDVENAAGTTFESNLGGKQFVINADDGGLELLLGDALVFGPDTVENYNY